MPSMNKTILSLILSILAVTAIFLLSVPLGTAGGYLLYYAHDTWIYERYFSNTLPFIIPVVCGALPAAIVGFLITKLKVDVNWKLVVSLPLIVAVSSVYLHVSGYFTDSQPLLFIETLGLVVGSLISPWILSLYLNPRIHVSN